MQPSDSFCYKSKMHNVKTQTCSPKTVGFDFRFLHSFIWIYFWQEDIEYNAKF